MPAARSTAAAASSPTSRCAGPVEGFNPSRFGRTCGRGRCSPTYAAALPAEGDERIQGRRQEPTLLGAASWSPTRWWPSSETSSWRRTREDGRSGLHGGRGVHPGDDPVRHRHRAVRRRRGAAQPHRDDPQAQFALSQFASGQQPVESRRLRIDTSRPGRGQSRRIPPFHMLPAAQPVGSDWPGAGSDAMSDGTRRCRPARIVLRSLKRRMRLERLEISGFKSFPDRADVAFDTGVTAIVGPNGAARATSSTPSHGCSASRAPRASAASGWKTSFSAAATRASRPPPPKCRAASSDRGRARRRCRRRRSTTETADRLLGRRPADAR